MATQTVERDNNMTADDRWNQNFEAYREFIQTRAHLARWEEHLDNYPDLYAPRDDRWNQNFEACKEFIQTRGRRPSSHSKDPEEKRLGRWGAKQQKD